MRTMMKHNWRHRSISILFVAATLTAAAPTARALEPPSTSYWYVMDREAWSRTDDARLVLTTYDLRNGPNLSAVPMQIGNWVGQDLVITNEETFPTLDAEQIVYRGYTNPDGQVLVLSLIGSTRGQSFHHPLVCYEWASWPAEDHGTTVVPTTDGDVVMRVVVGRDPDGPAQVDLHAYLWPNDRREWSDGATQIRVTALASKDEDTALEAARSFARLLFSRSQRVDASAPGAAAPAQPAAAPVPDAASPAQPAAPVPDARGGVSVVPGLLPPPVRPADAETAAGQGADQGGDSAASR
jgi:Protein of unknown function (DUF3485)